MKLKYIGKKEQGHTTFTKLTGIVWFPGDENEVKDEHAKVLLRHPDAFEAVTEKTATKGRTTVAAVTLTPGAEVGAGKTDPLAGMDDAAVRAFAKAQGLKIQGIGLLKAANLRAKVTAALQK